MGEKTRQNGERRSDNRSDVQSTSCRKGFTQGDVSLTFPAPVLTPCRP
jgi:hypothetical protein